ncbi:MAG TPA: hypothetical protein VME18_04800 [Acidobacteriaceae bacterium]|nr:hypothetical protein [Acidobacteriaceae bacterium]
MDYVAEFLPFVLPDQPAHLNHYGVPEGKHKQNMELVPGLGITPIGIRFLWRDSRAVEPYLMAKGGVLVFTPKADSPDGT